MATITPKQIPQSKMARYHELCKLLDEHKKLKEELLSLASLGIPCQPGRFVVSIEISPGQCRPAWREEAVKLAVAAGLDSKKYEEDVKKKKGRGDPIESLVIVDRDNPVNDKR